MQPTPSPLHIATQAALLARRHPDARVFGIHLPGPWLGAAFVPLRDIPCPVVCCTSALHISEVLAAHTLEQPPLVLLTPLDEAQLSLDVLARLAGQRLHRLDRWQMVRELFRAHDLDPRLLAQRWMADALLDKSPPDGYPPVASGWLDLETVWGHLCQQHLQLPDGQPDAVSLLTWSLDPVRLQHYTTLNSAFRAAWRQRLQDTAGAVGAAMLDALDAGHGHILLPIGLVCDVLYAPASQAQLDLAPARARLEPYLAGHELAPGPGRAWGAAARTVLGTLSEPEARLWLEQAERLLQHLRAHAFAQSSDLLPSGFDQRLQQCAAAWHSWLTGGASLEQVSTSVALVQQHQEAQRQRRRLERLHMALRLARALDVVEAESRTPSLAQSIATYVAQGSYLDWARRSLSAGDEHAALAEVFSVLAQRVQERREQHNYHFATHLADWYRTPGAIRGVLPIEQALDTLVAPLASAVPLLLLVLDGMSYAVFRELCADLHQQGWVALSQTSGTALPTLLSVLPSITELSRTSLLCGHLRRGTSRTETQHFAAHAALRAASRAGYAPLLFHKGDVLAEGALGLAASVRQAIRERRRRVVAVVVNAVDDHLAKTEQLHLAWSVAQFQHLSTLLYEAQGAGRAVLLTSDHGHILDTGSTRLTESEAERWRPDAGSLAASELRLSGPRLAAVTGVASVIVPWSETVRYSAQKKHGYHGGATLQEVLVPCGVFVAPGQTVTGWSPWQESLPAWWPVPDVPSS